MKSQTEGERKTNEVEVNLYGGTQKIVSIWRASYSLEKNSGSVNTGFLFL